MTNHEDNERHLQHWLDKNSWRRDLQRIDKEYGDGGGVEGHAVQDADETPTSSSGLIPANQVGGLGTNGLNPLCKGQPESSPARRPLFTDEFHFDAMSVIRYLGEALAYRPILRLCPRCSAPVRTHAGELPHLCTVCAELAS